VERTDNVFYTDYVLYFHHQIHIYMPYKYYKPEKVVSPRAHVEYIKTIFDGKTGKNPFSIAELKWDGQKRYGIRWNVSENEWDDPKKKSGVDTCLGLPSSRSYPTWFILPDLLFPEIENTLKEIQD
jgi:hypothetical protein